MKKGAATFLKMDVQQLLQTIGQMQGNGSSVGGWSYTIVCLHHGKFALLGSSR